MPKYCLSRIKAVRPAVFRYIAIFVIVAAAQQGVFASQSVTLRWEPSVSPGVAGYHVYYGTESGHYFNRVYVTTDTSTSVSGLQEGTTYYFVVTAYDDSGVESDPSNEVAYAVPRPELRMEQIASGEFSKAFSVVSSGHATSRWELEASEDLRTWRTLARGTNSIANVAVLVSSYPALFFRLKSQTAGISLAMQKMAANGFPDSYFIAPEGSVPSQWTLETSRDLVRWSTFTSGTNSPPNVAVIISTAPKMFFRLKIQ